MYAGGAFYYNLNYNNFLSTFATLWVIQPVSLVGAMLDQLLPYMDSIPKIEHFTLGSRWGHA